MGEHDKKAIWGNDFHFLPFVSIFGASTIGAVNASMVMAGNGMPASHAISFFLAWAVLTCLLLIGGNRLFDQEDLMPAFMGSLVRRTASGISCVGATLLVVFVTYKTVDMAGAPSSERVVAKVFQQPVTQPVVVAKPVTQEQVASNAGRGTESIYFRRSDIIHDSQQGLPAPIAPPSKELVSLPDPLRSIDPDKEAETKPEKTFAEGQEVSISDAAIDLTPKAQNSKKVVRKKRKIVRTKRKKPKTVKQVATQKIDLPNAADPQVEGASAPASDRLITGLTTEHTKASTSGKSAECSNGHRSLTNKACRELGAFSR